MNLNQKINKNSVIQIVGKLIGVFLGLGTVALMTRYLGDEKYGYYTTVTAFLQVFGILADFGLSLTIVQMIAKDNIDENKVVSNIFTWRLLSSVVLIGLAPLAVLFFPYTIEIKVGVFICSFSVFATTLISILTGVFQKHLKLLPVSIAEVTARLFLFFSVYAITILGWGFYWIMVAISISALINLAIIYFSSLKLVKIRLAFDWPVWKEIWKITWPLALSIFFNLIYLKTDVLILGWYRSQSDVGLYGAAYRVVDILTLLPAVYMGVVLPQLTLFFNANKKTELFDLMQRTFNTLMLFGVPIVVGTFLISEKIMVFVAGGDFAASGAILNILILASGAIFVISLFGYAVVVLKKQKTMIWGYLTTAVITLIGYFLFIPRYGYFAAAWLTVFSEIMVMIWTIVLVYKTIKFFPKFDYTLKCLAASLMMFIVIYYTQKQSVLVILCLAIIVYFSMLIAMGVIKKNFIKESINVVQK